MTLQPDGKFIIVGAEETGDSINHYRRFLVMRFLPDGSPDPNFGAGGKVVTNFPYLLAWAGSAYTLPDNRILVVGDTYNSTNYSQVALARYFGDSKVYLPLITKP